MPTEYQQETTETPEQASERAHVARWQSRILDAKKKWSPDYTRMRANMDFVAGLQWTGQKDLSSKAYVANFTLRMVNHKVSSLYARNPQFTAERRPRMDFMLWDGKVETLQEAVQAMGAGQAQGLPPTPEIIALLADYDQGKKRQQLVDRVCQTLKIVFEHQLDAQEPSFKQQAKALVRRVVVAGVGYIRVNFIRDGAASGPTQSVLHSSTLERARAAGRLLQRMADGEFDEESADYQQLRILTQSIMAGTPPEQSQLSERLEFDFPAATSVIVDKNCRCIKGFIGARWIAEEFVLPRNYVASFFERPDLKSCTGLTLYNEAGEAIERPPDDATQGDENVRLWEVFDKDARSSFIICEGYKDYIVSPAPVEPLTKSFWPVFALSFNDIETEPGCKAPVYPPSDVELIKHPQTEWNLARQALRDHRKANRPRYVVPKGTLSPNDVLEFNSDKDVLELEQLPPGTEPGKVLQPLQVIPISPTLYDTAPLMEDTLLTTGTQESNMGPAQSNVTATVGTIAEQSRMSVASSNVDDLDDLLTNVAECSVEMLLREMSTAVVAEIAGPGAAFPQQERDTFIKEISFHVMAASSGRPNGAMEVAKFERIAPTLIQMGANPQAVIREGVKVYDSNLQPEEFFPVAVPMVQGVPQEQPTAPSGKRAPGGPAPAQPLQQLQSESPVPLAAS